MERCTAKTEDEKMETVSGNKKGTKTGWWREKNAGA